MGRSSWLGYGQFLMFDELDDFLKEGSNIFNPQAKVLANVENAIEFVETQNTSRVATEDMSSVSTQDMSCV